MRNPIKSLLTLFIVLFALALPFFVATKSGEASLSLLSLIPPLLAVSLALSTQNIYISLGTAVAYGAILHTGIFSSPSFVSLENTFRFLANQFTSALTDPANLQILGFVVLVLTAVRLSLRAGGFAALVNWISRFVQSQRSAERITAFLGLSLFIDDYANTMIVGSAMRPMTDRFSISREKLAFLVDATSAPVAGIALVSTWVGYEVGLFNQVAESLSLGLDGYDIFFSMIAYRFYCIFMILFVLYMVFLGTDFGPMRRASSLAPGSCQDLEKQKQDHIRVADGTDEHEVAPGAKPHLATAVVPFVSLVVSVIVGLWYDGGGFAKAYSPFSLSAWQSVLSASENGLLILVLSAVLGYLLALGLSLGLAKLRLAEIIKTSAQGFRSALLPVIILLLAWALKGVCDALQTGEYVASALGGQINPGFLPLIIFITAALMAFATGTSWGTMSILIPTVGPLALTASGVTASMAPEIAVSSGELMIFLLSMAAILDGAILGDHCSPISDTTIMSSISSGCDHVEHVKTQMPYALLVGVAASLFGYLLVGFGFHLGLAFALFAGLLLVTYALTRPHPVARNGR